LIATHDEAAADRVVVRLPQHTPSRAERAKAHPVRVPWQSLVLHEEQLHRLIEGDLVLAEKLQAAALTDPAHRGDDVIRICGLGLRPLEAGEDGTIGAMPHTGERERAIEAHRDLLRGFEETIALEARGELPCRAHRAHGMWARRTDAHLEDGENA